MAKEQLQPDYSFIYLYGRDLRPLNYKVLSDTGFFGTQG
jgi:hypothetical protein